MAEFSGAETSAGDFPAEYETAAVGATVTGESEYLGYLRARLRSLTKAAEGKSAGGEDNSWELRSIEAIKRILD